MIENEMFTVLVIGSMNVGKSWFLNQIIHLFDENIKLPTGQKSTTNCLFKIIHNDNPKPFEPLKIAGQNKLAKADNEIEIQLNMKIEGQVFERAVFYDSPGFEEKDKNSWFENMMQKKIDYKTFDLIIFITTPDMLDKDKNGYEILKKIANNKNVWIILNKITIKEDEQTVSIDDLKKSYKIIDNTFKFYEIYENGGLSIDFLINLNSLIKIETIAKAKYQINLIEKKIALEQNKTSSETTKKIIGGSLIILGTIGITIGIVAFLPVTVVSTSTFLIFTTVTVMTETLLPVFAGIAISSSAIAALTSGVIVLNLKSENDDYEFNFIDENNWCVKGKKNNCIIKKTGNSCFLKNSIYEIHFDI